MPIKQKHRIFLTNENFVNLTKCCRNDLGNFCMHFNDQITYSNIIFITNTCNSINIDNTDSWIKFSQSKEML